jgi:hypothetical protein
MTVSDNQCVIKKPEFYRKPEVARMHSLKDNFHCVSVICEICEIPLICDSDERADSTWAAHGRQMCSKWEILVFPYISHQRSFQRV